MTRAYIEVTTKPRLIKRYGRWVCVGLSKTHWFASLQVFTSYANTYQEAFDDWVRLTNTFRVFK